jgi:hypothetical protein
MTGSPAPRARWGLALVCASFMTVACRQAPAAVDEPAPASVKAASEREAVSALRRFVVRIAPMPDPIPLNEFFTLDVLVANAAAPFEPLQDVEIAVDATMPAHGHGMNTSASLERTSSGVKAQGLLFHMPGEWQIWVDIGPERERARFTITVP